jgi:hypothetical protein
MQQSPSREASSRLENEYSRILWTPEFRYCIHKSPLLAPTLSQFIPRHPLTSWFFKIYFNIILPIYANVS